MSLSKAVSRAAADHLQLIQLQIDNINKYLAATTLTPAARAAIEQRRGIYIELAASAMDLYKLIKGEQKTAEFDKFMRINEDLKSTLKHLCPTPKL